MMLNQLLSIMTPDSIIYAIKSNPKVIIDTLHKFDTFKLLGSCLTLQQQEDISNNANLIDNFLSQESGKSAVTLLAEEFSSFVKQHKETNKEVIVETPLQLEQRIRQEVEKKVRAEMLANNAIFPQTQKAA